MSYRNAGFVNDTIAVTAAGNMPEPDLGSGPIDQTKNRDVDSEPETDLDQPAGGMPVLTAN
jgi:hypothetical protein